MVRMPRPRTINHNTRRQRSHCDCGKELKEEQAWYCSIECRNRYNNSGGKVLTLAEPKTDEEVRLFNQSIEEGKEVVENEDKELVRRLTPPDDSPEAERNFREAICPHPQYSCSAQTMSIKRSKVMK